MKTKFADEQFMMGETPKRARICVSVMADYRDGGRVQMFYNSIKELMEDWEDGDGES